MACQKHHSVSKKRLATLGFLGGGAVGLGGLGAFGVCHTICTAVVAGLAAIGITGLVMPFAFLQNRWFIIISFSLGLVSLLVAGWYWLALRRRHQDHHCSPPCQEGQSADTSSHKCC